ncbi:hypothetical protein CEXT_62521 [Caerostris extrusa]|uniref:Uncharacterized protein n=1 Tax=Caerostris extrusa TaxID=172846 RepID=A0AAV4M7V2_CAEEX|nr:hypothetical protein CEXT_62521 [Caerostris extrusa]
MSLANEGKFPQTPPCETESSDWRKSRERTRLPAPVHLWLGAFPNRLQCLQLIPQRRLSSEVPQLVTNFVLLQQKFFWLEYKGILLWNSATKILGGFDSVPESRK